MGLLDYDIELAKNKLRSLLDAAPEYVNQLTQNVRNITGQNNAANLFAMRNLDAMAGGDLKQNISQNVQEGRDKGMEMALNFNPSAVGMTAWHGSPHKFDKFDLAKIGTGEGAQAYGHGAYLAEAKDVGKEYQLALGNKPSAVDDFAGFEAQAAFAKHGGNTKKAIAWLEDRKKLTDDAKQFLMPGAYEKQIGDYNEAIRRIQSGEVSKEAGYLYKTDIPDEAVARFLDWDKPLSQQAPEVQKALSNYYDADKRKILDLIRIGEHPDGFGILNSADGFAPIINGEVVGSGARDLTFKSIDEALGYISNHIPSSDPTAASIYRTMVNEHGGADGISQSQVSNFLKQQGIPGIRYLDGGSRAAGQGSSNFVIFDPNMIRIIERNGQATGAQPWKPGEWKGLLGE